ncbi:Metallo-dependent phosphatase-like protein [Scenedesmus sp. NREL 46B-D3]|nr:Metallo-dependent phosphatase-like protein [Scenedesmus sp. NREL 46B-D3]
MLQVCQAMSFRQQQLPAVASRQPFSLVLSADPQLFRVVSRWKDVPRALQYNTQLVDSINRIGELQQWPWRAGGGPVLDPHALVVLGDMTEHYREDELDAFRHLYDPSFPREDAETEAAASSSSAAASEAAAVGIAEAAAADGAGSEVLQQQEGQLMQQQDSSRDAGVAADTSQQLVSLPTWLMFGNHDYVNNVHDCPGQYKGLDKNVCAKRAVDNMRAVLTPGCDDDTWGSFPRDNVTSFDVDSMAYSFDYSDWHFVVLQYSPRYVEASLSVEASMAWLASELSTATAQQRRIVLLLHSHRELGLASDPGFARMLTNSNVAAIFYGHVHIKPWGMTGNFPNTNVPMFNCGASWYHVYCYAEFGPDRLRVAAVVHNVTTGSTQPQWAGHSVHALLRQQKAKPVLQQFTMNPNSTLTSAAAGVGAARVAAAAVTAAMLAVLLTALVSNL